MALARLDKKEMACDLERSKHERCRAFICWEQAETSEAGARYCVAPCPETQKHRLRISIKSLSFAEKEEMETTTIEGW